MKRKKTAPIKSEPVALDVPQKRTKTSVILTRCAHSENELPDSYIYTGHPDDSLFEFIYQELGYSITIVETDDNGNISARPM